MSRQLILNPFRGHPEEERNIMDRGLEETIKELATIDGAFVVRGDGVVESCGVLLKTAGQEEFQLPQGLGARHHAAAGITSVTRATAVTVSESTGNVMAYGEETPPSYHWPEDARFFERGDPILGRTRRAGAGVWEGNRPARAKVS
jgi:DNA integrity scanning protein DisA with diadenylate cyclase activity